MKNVESLRFADDIDDQTDADLLTAANDALRRALDDASVGEHFGKLAGIGFGAFALAAVVGFVGAAVAIKVLK